MSRDKRKGVCRGSASGTSGGEGLPLCRCTDFWERSSTRSRWSSVLELGSQRYSKPFERRRRLHRNDDGGFLGLPETGGRAWPGREGAKTSTVVEATLLDNLVGLMGGNFASRRFVPYIVMHEFEALLFSDCGAFSSGIGRPDLHASLQDIRDRFATPEEINDSLTTAPSKRILDLFPQYQKPIYGNLAVLEIGLDRIRRECPHFGNWLNRLEAANV